MKAMTVYNVLEVSMNPYGEEGGYCGCFGTYFSKRTADARIQELKEKHIKGFSNKHGELRVRMPKWVAVKTEVKL